MNRNSRRRWFAWSLLLTMVLQVCLPMTSWALTSGPSQPEVQGFTPAGDPEVVDLFTGDASYNIPIMDVEGYPINLSYRAGINMDQEATWVGLGWSLGAGQVERTVRGLPDDFAGDPMTRELNLRPNRTFGFDLGVNVELFGGSADNLPFSLSASIQPSFNNYNGPRMEIGATLSMRSTQGGKSGMTAGLGVSASSDASLTIQPTIGYDKTFGTAQGWGKGGLNFGASINSREGLQDVSFGASVMRGQEGRRGRTAQIGRASFDLGPKVYSPEVTIPMENISVSGSLQPVAVEVWGTNTGIRLGGYYSCQKLAATQLSKPAFGYLHLQAGENNPSAMLDFSREGDGQYTPNQSHLPVASLACDAFSVTSQNMNGSYRAYRTAVGHVFDSRTTCSGSGGSVGVELGVGALTHVGGDIIVNEQTSTCGDWTDHSPASGMLRFGRSAGEAPEQVYFREANEFVVDRDPAQYEAFQGDQARRLNLVKVGGYNYALQPAFDNGQSLPGQNALQERQPRGTVFSYLTHRQVEQGFGLEAVHDRPSTSPLVTGSGIRGHHISEVAITGKDGSRNFYGLPAYNITQCDVSFAMADLHNEPQASSQCTYSDTEASAENEHGKDHFFSKNRTPAHAYAFLLTAAVSPDYSDADGVRGPSDGDLGTWHRFHYSLVDPEYHWRTPVGDHTAAAQAGLAYAKDDRANFSFGTKEVWSLNAVEGRNLIAVFFTSPREDGLGVAEDGSIDEADRQVKLDSIGLYTREQAAAAVLSEHWPCSIRTAHFQYDYSLCPETPNSGAEGLGGPNGTRDGGKLTLRKLWFSYGCSTRGVTSPYKFQYGDEADETDNPVYFADATDRWGGLRPVPGWEPSGVVGTWDLPTRDYPYAVQDPDAAMKLVQAWNLTRIKTPSAKVTTIAYEPDVYGHVQDQEPTTMFRLIGACTDAQDPDDDEASATVLLPDAKYLKFEVPLDYQSDTGVQSLIPPGPIYYRSRVRVFQGTPLTNTDGYDYVSGYAEVVDAGCGDDDKGWVELKHVHIDNDNDGNVQPMFRSALEFARLNYPDRVFQVSEDLVFDDDEDSNLEGFIMAAASASLAFISGVPGFFVGPNQEIMYNQGGLCKSINYSGSYIRLLSPGGVKVGGGHRVSEVTYADSWDQMTSSGEGMRYGKRYTYTEEDGVTTSGVAVYEPMLGADENCLRHPVYHEVHRCLTPDQRFYQEEPFAESLYPSPSVGYRRVVVSDFVPDDENVDPNQMAGITVHEFFTATDFPVKASRTGIQEKPARSGRFSLLSLLGFKTVDNMHVSQGMRVETNDMHGKPRRTLVYPQGSSAPISSEEYVYATNGGTLSNTAKVIEPDGTIHDGSIGRHYEFLFDLRQFSSDAISAGVAINTDVILLFGPNPVVVPWPKFSSERTRFRSANFVKKIHRFGLLKRIVRTESGRTTTTENMAYDAITGNVLLTKVNNDFNAPIYSMTLPAYWYYDGMGPAYQNTGLSSPTLTFSSGTAMGQDLDQRFVPGDEVMMTQGSTVRKGWVSEVSISSVQVIDQLGTLDINGAWALRVLRSGRRNMQSVPMTTLTMLNDPMVGMPSNSYPAVVNVQVAEFSDTWRTTCECVTSGQIQPTENPFILGTRGLWRLNKERAWLTERTRSTENNNSDIRRDGVYATYAPFYRLNNGRWEKHEVGWVTTREVTDYNGRGQELENKDALGILSSATFGRRGTLVKSIAKNAGYRDQGFDDFEDISPADCGDRHFRIPGSTTDDAAHTGLRSLQVQAGSPATLSVDLTSPCSYRACTLLVAVVPESSPLEVHVSGGTAPFNMAPVPLSGDPVFNLLSGGNGISATGTGSFQLSVTDAAGCQASTQVQLP